MYSFIPLLLVSFAEFLPHSLTFIRRYISEDIVAGDQMECTVTLGLDTEDDVVHKPTQYITMV